MTQPRTASVLAALAVATLATAAPAQRSREMGQETTIPYTANGGVRAYQIDRADHRIVYMQDSQLRWYRVTLTGDCLSPDKTDTLVTKIRGNSRIDRFAQVGSTRYPGRVCGIRSIVNSPTPAGQPGAKLAGKQGRQTR